jgi:hypothetical protein
MSFYIFPPARVSIQRSVASKSVASFKIYAQFFATLPLQGDEHRKRDILFFCLARFTGVFLGLLRHFATLLRHFSSFHPCRGSVAHFHAHAKPFSRILRHLRHFAVRALYRPSQCVANACDTSATLATLSPLILARDSQERGRLPR